MWQGLFKLSSFIYAYKAKTLRKSTYSYIQPPGKIIKPGPNNMKRGRPPSKAKYSTNE